MSTAWSMPTTTGAVCAAGSDQARAAGGGGGRGQANGDEVSQGTAKAIHYWKARYPSEPGADSYRDYGQPDLQKGQPTSARILRHG